MKGKCTRINKIETPEKFYGGDGKSKGLVKYSEGD